MQILLQITESINPSLVAYGFGTLFGIFAILYFARDILLSLSLTVKSIIMFSASLSLISLAVTTSNIAIAIVLFTIGGSGHAISSFSFLKWHNRERMGRFILFALSSVIFILLGWLVGSGTINELTLQIGGVFSIVLMILSVIASVVDWNEGDTVAYEVSISEPELYLIGDKEVEDSEAIGKVKIENNSRFFRESFNEPNIKGKFNINDLEDTLPIKVDSSDFRDKTRSIASGDEIEMNIILDNRHLKRRLKEDDIDPSGKYYISVEDRESHQFQVEENENINIKIE